MSDTRKHIDELEAKAAEYALIAKLAVNPDARGYNALLAAELYDTASKLRAAVRLAVDGDRVARSGT